MLFRHDPIVLVNSPDHQIAWVPRRAWKYRQGRNADHFAHWIFRARPRGERTMVSR
jgi:hypothetical protein